MNKNSHRSFITILLLNIISYSALTQAVEDCSALEQVDVTQGGLVIGDGVTDDTLEFQQKLTYCSQNGASCIVPAGAEILLDHVVYLWGDSCLVGPGKITFDIDPSDNTDKPDETYLLAIGISGKSNGNAANNQAEAPFTGRIENLFFSITDGEPVMPPQGDFNTEQTGRLIFFFRTDGAVIENNYFDLTYFNYSATSSGNNNNWLSGVPSYIRNDIAIKNNQVIATSFDEWGSEGIGLELFNGVLIEGNVVRNVGDDPIGIHISENVIIRNNDLESVDGRIYVSNSVDVEISHNIHRRVTDMNGVHYGSIALVQLGFEINDAQDWPAPTRTHIYRNELFVPAGSPAAGGMIYIWGPRDVVVENNYLHNDSTSTTAGYASIYVLPAVLTSWNDPTGLDVGNVARVHAVTIQNNLSAGASPKRMIMTGNCIQYVSPAEQLKVINNWIEGNLTAPYQFYCGVVPIPAIENCLRHQPGNGVVDTCDYRIPLLPWLGSLFLGGFLFSVYWVQRVWLSPMH